MSGKICGYCTNWRCDEPLHLKGHCIINRMDRFHGTLCDTCTKFQSMWEYTRHLTEEEKRRCGMNNKAHLRPQDYDSNGDIIPTACKEEKGDLISRKWLTDAIRNRRTYLSYEDAKDVIDLIDNAPTLEERPQGEWKETMNSFYICSLCGKYGNPNFFNFCPNCGADMRKDEEDG